MSGFDDNLKDLFNPTDLENNVVDFTGNKDIVREGNNKSFSNITDNVDKTVDDVDDNKPVTSEDIKFVLEIISKQAPYDKTQIMQIFYGICSSQTSTKIHHIINSKKSGEGKSYLLKLVSDLFPDSFILKFNNMSDKALYHQQGFEAVKDEQADKYEELNPVLNELEGKIEELQEMIDEEKNSKVQKQKDKLLIKSYKPQIKEIDEKIKDLKSKAVKIIDLDDKAFIFLDTPNDGLFNNLMSILSQDNHEQLYIFTDKDSSGKHLQARTVLLRGSPLIMSTQVVDDTRNYRFAEKNRRFINVNPDTTENKIGEAMRQMAIKLGGPSDDFECIVSKEDTKKAKEIVTKLCEKLKDHNQRFLYNGIKDNGIKIPYASILYSSLPTSDAWSMTVLTRLLNYIAIITKVNMDSRPKIVDTETGVFYPISIYDDLKEALKIMETASLSIRPYQQDWLTNVFLPAFEELDPEPNCKKSMHDGHIIATESVVGLATKQLADKMNQLGMNSSISSIYENYLRPLTKQGIINSVRSVLNGKENLYFPVNSDIENSLSVSILPLTEDCRLIMKKSLDEKNILEESLETLSRRRSNGDGDKYKIVDVDGAELSKEALLDEYFFNKNYCTSCSVILTKFSNNTIEYYSILEQTKDSENPLNKAEDVIIDSTTLPDSSTNYSYTKEDIENFFAYDNGQVENHTLEEGICWPLIGRQNHKPFFYYCKEHPKVENIHLISIENHIRLAEPEKHKAKLLEYLEKEKENNRSLA